MRFEKSKSVVRISAEDEILFRYLFENRVATSHQIHRDVYLNYSYTSVQNRLLKLAGNRFVRRSYYEGIRSSFVYSLDNAGYTKYIKHLGVKRRRDFGSHAIVHDLNLLEIRRILQASNSIKRYIPEALIGIDDGLGDEGIFIDGVNPDAIVMLDLDSKTFLLGLEYESASKFHHRYVDFFHRYYSCKSLSGVLYICKDSAILNRVKAIETKVIETEVPKFYYSDYSKWNDVSPKRFTSLDGSCISV